MKGFLYRRQTPTRKFPRIKSGASRLCRSAKTFFVSACTSAPLPCNGCNPARGWGTRIWYRRASDAVFFPRLRGKVVEREARDEGGLHRAVSTEGYEKAGDVLESAAPSTAAARRSPAGGKSPLAISDPPLPVNGGGKELAGAQNGTFDGSVRKGEAVSVYIDCLGGERASLVK